MKRANQKGFTIVELLIVIVVIAILAAITIVAYNGISERARMSSALSFASQMKHQGLADAGGYWTFDDCSGSTAKSDVSSATDATIVGTATWSTDTPTGKGCSLQFNGSTRLNPAVPLSATYYFKGAWVKTTNCSGSNNIISRGDTTGSSDAPFYFASCVLKAGHQGNYAYVTSPNILSANKWYYVAVEYDNGTMKLFEDGKVVSTTTGVPAPNNTPTPGVNIGSHAGGNFFNGLIDDPIIIIR